MDDAQFDDFVRAFFSLCTPRRRVLAGSVSALLTPVSFGETREDAVAGNRNKCRRRKKRCGGKCVNTATDPRHCGRCGTRCQLNAICKRGNCTCANGACTQPDASCCPVGSVVPCRCFGANNISGVMADPKTCNAIDVTDCPTDRRCVGPTCQACCPVGSTCDPDTGTCLR